MIFQGVRTPSPLLIRPWHASERRYLSEMFLSVCGDHQTQSRTRLQLLVCMFAPDQARLLDLNFLQTLIAGCKRRERERQHGVCTRIFCFCLVSQSIKTQCLGQSINLVTTASDEDPKPKLILRIGFCTAKSDIPQYYM